MGVGLVVFALLVTLLQGVFCQTWKVTLPQSIVGIRGSCVTVPCRFEVPKSHEQFVQNCSDKGVWRRGSLSGPLVLQSKSPQTNTLQGGIVGDLTKKNCTTVFHSFPEDYGDIYFFRLDCTEELKFTFVEAVNIIVRPGPSRPLLTSVSQLSEGDQVRLQCSVPLTCSTLPPSITWLTQHSSRQEETQTLQPNADGEMIMTSTLTFIASAEHHNQSVSCSVTYPLTEGGSTEPSAATQRLSVLYAPRFTVATLSRSGSVSEGSFVTFTCSSEANPPVSLYTWYRVDTGELSKEAEGEMLVLRVSQRDSGVYLCEAHTRMGSQRSRPVSLEVNATAGSSDSGGVIIPYIICGVVLLLYILTVVVDVYKYQSLSRRLKQIELKGEHTYADLRTNNVTSDYDRLQPQQQKTVPPPDPNYENLQKSTSKPKHQLQPKQT